jgi:hypothetical protein
MGVQIIKTPFNLDEITRKAFEAEDGEDPYCCTPTRQSVVNDIRGACGLERLKTDIEIAREQGVKV